MTFFNMASLRRRWREPQGYRTVLRVGLPLVAGMASSTVMQFTDRLFLSHYSVESIAAALPASLAAFTSQIVLMGVCSYATVLIAQYSASRAFERVGPALWQGIWCALFGGILLAALYFAAEPFFSWTAHGPLIEEQEIIYFQILTLGVGAGLLGNAFGAFFSGVGRTRPVMVANVAAMVINVPLDYLFIFGGFGIPEMGIFGAGLATVIGWLVMALILGCLVFTQEHEEKYHVISGWRFEGDLFRRLLRFGLPSGFNSMMELVTFTWFVFVVGNLSQTALAASNIAMSINAVAFLPMFGLNIAVSTLVGHAMGRGKPEAADRVTSNTLHVAFAYMIPLSLLFVCFPGLLMDLFAPGGMSAVEYGPVREAGIVLLYFVALYCLIDACNIIYFGALKGVGDTLAMMLIIICCAVFALILPICFLLYTDRATLNTLWIVFTAYVFVAAFCVMIRFKSRRWRTIRVVETAPEVDDVS